MQRPHCKKSDLCFGQTNKLLHKLIILALHTVDWVSEKVCLQKVCCLPQHICIFPIGRSKLHRSAILKEMWGEKGKRHFGNKATCRTVIYRTPYRQVRLVFQVLIHTPFDDSDNIQYNMSHRLGEKHSQVQKVYLCPLFFFFSCSLKNVDLCKHDSWTILSKPGMFKHLN